MERAPLVNNEICESPIDQEQEQEQNHARARIYSPWTTRQASSDEESFESLDSLPSYDSFKSLHLLYQLPFSFVILISAFFGLWFSTNEIRWTEMGLGGAGFLSSEAMKTLVFSLLTRETSEGEPRLGLPTIVISILQEVMRLGATYIVVKLLPIDTFSMPSVPASPHRPLPPLDTLFFSALFLAWGWSLFELVFASLDFYRKMELYSDVLEDSRKEIEVVVQRRRYNFEEEYRNYGSTNNSTPLAESSNRFHQQENSDSKTIQNHDGPLMLSASAFESLLDPLEQEEEEEEFELRLRAKERDDIEKFYGLPLFEIPAVVVCIWRLDSCLLSLVLSLLIALPFRTTSPSLFVFSLWPTFILATFAHSLISLLWVTRTRVLGVPALSYLSFVLLLGSLFAVLASWGFLR